MAERLGASRATSCCWWPTSARPPAPSLGKLRIDMARRLGLLDDDVLAFAWVIDPPLLEWNNDENRWDAVHHPFTMPMPEDVHLLDTDPGAVRATAYDIVCNGYELGHRLASVSTTAPCRPRSSA